jgi:hypothetical protein
VAMTLSVGQNYFKWAAAVSLAAGFESSEGSSYDTPHLSDFVNHLYKNESTEQKRFLLKVDRTYGPYVSTQLFKNLLKQQRRFVRSRQQNTCLEEEQGPVEPLRETFAFNSLQSPS